MKVTNPFRHAFYFSVLKMVQVSGSFIYHLNYSISHTEYTSISKILLIYFKTTNPKSISNPIKLCMSYNLNEIIFKCNFYLHSISQASINKINFNAINDFSFKHSFLLLLNIADSVLIYQYGYWYKIIQANYHQRGGLLLLQKQSSGNQYVNETPQSSSILLLPK